MRLHPLAELYREAKRVASIAEEKLAEIAAELEEIEAELARINAMLVERYGIGYLTVKSVRNKQGKKYRYPVWRSLDGKDEYLDKRLAQKVLELRARRKELEAHYKRYRRALRAAKLYMKQYKEYSDVCIAENGEYVKCP